MNRLKDKLARLHGKKRDTETSESVNDSIDVPNAEIQDSIVEDQQPLTYEFDDPYKETYKKNQIGLFTNEFGSFLFKRTVYPLSHYHGMYQLQQLKHIAPFLNRFNDEDAYLHEEQLLFFDLETTGLGTGTGNIPFMVGLAYFKDNTCIVEQAVIRHVAEERALLAYLHRLTAHYTHIVTYNGKTFDWPLIVNRYILNGMREEMWQPKHIDLLHPSRFIWRNALQSCKLSYIEEARLGITRIDDLPGSEAPDRYFKYLADFNPEHIIPVFQHNELDMLTLVSLLTRFGYLLTDQDVNSIIQMPIEPEEMIRTGLWLEKMGLTSQCERLFNVAIHLPLNYAPTLYKLSIRDKQMGEDERAIYLWEKIIESDHLDIKAKIDCCIQLAMYYEHKDKQYERAINYTKQAITYHMTLILEQKRNKSLIDKQQELEKRLNRIIAKRDREN